MHSPLVAEAIEHFDSLLKNRFPPADWCSGFVEDLKRHWVEEAPMDAYAVRPFMVEKQQYEQLKQSLLPVVKAFSIASDRLASDETLRRKLAIPEYLDALIEIDAAHGKPTCLARIDGIMGEDGRLSVIEYNSEPQSAPFQYELGRALAKQPIAAEFKKSFPTQEIDLYQCMYDALLSRAKAKGARSMPAIAVLKKDLWASKRTATWFRPLMYCSSRGCPVIYADPAELEYSSGRLRCGDVEIDMVAFVGWSLLINERDRISHIISAISEQAVEVLSGVSRGLLSSYKCALELLSDPEHRDMFPAEVVRSLELHVPWTRVLRQRKTEFSGKSIDLVAFVSANKDRFVIKPAGSGGGLNVVVGHAVSPREWAAAVKRGLALRAVVQECVIPRKQTFAVADNNGSVDFLELNCEFTPYVWNAETIEGVLCRVSSGAVLSDIGDRPIGTANGIDTATWIVSR